VHEGDALAAFERCLRRGLALCPYKAALTHLTAVLALALCPEIAVNAVAPGLIDTPWTAGLDESRDRVARSSPLRRPARADDVAEVCWSVAQMRYTTGEVFLVDGGIHRLSGP